MPTPIAPRTGGSAARPAADPSIASDNFQGALWLLGSAVAATAMTISIRFLSPDIPTPMLAFLRSALGLWVLLPLAASGRLGGVRFRAPWLHLIRGGLMAIALNCGFYAIATLDMATATILFFLAPIFATALAGPFLGERVGVWRWSAVAAGFLGAAIILRPGSAPLEFGMLAALASAACFSVQLLLGKKLAQVDGPDAVLVSSAVVAAVATAPLAAPVWTPPPTLAAWVLVGALTLASTARLYADIRAYAIGEAGFLAPFSYIRLIFIAAAGWALFREIPDGWTWAGGGVVIAAALVIAHRERRLSRDVSRGAAP